MEQTDLSPAERLQKAIRAYFRAEQSGSYFLLVWGALTLTTGIWLLCAFGQPFWKGMAPPLAALGAIQFTVGATIAIRTPGQVRRLLSTMLQPDALNGEIGRMEAVEANFGRLRAVESGLFLLGMCFLLGGVFGNFGEYMPGSGAGLCLQSAVSLIFDLLASWRAGLYLHELKTFQKTA
jgi:hypothetical protein